MAFLPENISPSHYRLKLWPNFEGDKFSGEVEIDFEISGITDSVALHCRDLEVFFLLFSLFQILNKKF